MVTRLLQEAKPAVRRLVSAPAYAVAMIVTLSACLAAFTSIDMLSHGLASRQLAVRSPDGIVTAAIRDDSGNVAGLPYYAYAELEASTLPVSAKAGAIAGMLLIAERPGHTPITAAVDGVTESFFDLAGLEATAGRMIGTIDRVPDGEVRSICVLSHAFATRVFSSPGQSVGQVLRLGELELTVIGVTPPAYTGMQAGTNTDITVPLATLGAALGGRRRPSPQTVWFRLADGASAATLRAALTSVWPEILATVRKEQGPRRTLTFALHARGTGASPWRELHGALLTALRTCTIWLFVLCAINLACLAIARTLERRGEMSVRAAIGANRLAVMLPTTMEAVLLVLVSSVIALGASRVIGGLMIELLSVGNMPLYIPSASMGRQAGVLIAAGVAAVALLGLAPAWIASARLVLSHGAATRTTGRTRVIEWALVAQLACSMTVLACGAVVVSGTRSVFARDSGVRAKTVTLAMLTSKIGGYKGIDDGHYYHGLLDAVRQVRGVQAAALARPTPGFPVPDIVVPVHTVQGTSKGAAVPMSVVYVTGDYFDVLEIPMLRGRALSLSDRAGAAPVAVLSNAAALRLFPAGDAIGGTLTIESAKSGPLTVVGVSRDASVLNPKTITPAVVFISSLQAPFPAARNSGLMVRADQRAGFATTDLATAIVKQDRETPLFVRSLDRHITLALGRERLAGSLALASVLTALSLAALGVSSAFYLLVIRRRQEWAMRMALGATPAAIRRYVRWRAIRVLSVGFVVGLAPAALALQATTKIVPGSVDIGPISIAMAVVALVVVALAASETPARMAGHTSLQSQLSGAR
jgi:putative ABC transport system permease protein